MGLTMAQFIRLPIFRQSWLKPKGGECILKDHRVHVRLLDCVQVRSKHKSKYSFEEKLMFSKTIRVLTLLSIIAAAFAFAPAATAGPASCDFRTRDNFKKLLLCVTVAGG